MATLGVDHTHSISQKWIIPTPPHTSYCIVVQCLLKPLPMRRTLHIPFTPTLMSLIPPPPFFYLTVLHNVRFSPKPLPLRINPPRSIHANTAVILNALHQLTMLYSYFTEALTNEKELCLLLSSSSPSIWYSPHSDPGIVTCCGTQGK